MSEQERGAYTPPHADAPLSFDPRQPVRGARPIPLTLILSVLVLAALVAAILWFYQSGVRQAGEAPQTVGAPVAGSIKEAAKDDAQPQDEAGGLQVYRADEGGQLQTVPSEPTFAPPPETPQARPTTPVVVTEAPPAKPAPPPPAATSQALKPALPATPAAKPAPAPVEKKVAVAPPPPEKKVASAPEAKAPAAKVATSGAARVQIGAVSSPALADAAWKQAVAAAPGLAAGKGKAVEKIEGGTLYRTFVTGFATRADAQAFCARLQGAGKSCFVR